VALKHISTKDASSHGIKMIVHGQAGAGKTRLCGTTGDHKHTVILSAEAGLLSLQQHDIAGFLIESIDDMREALIEIRTNKEKYKWVCIDSLSEIAEVCLSSEKLKTPNGMKAYGEMAEIMLKLIRAFRDTPGPHVVFTAKQERINDDGRLVYAPMLPGQQLSKNISYLFDEVFALRTDRADDKVRRYLYTVNDGTYEAKDRSGKLDAAEPCNLEKIVAKIMAERQPALPSVVAEYLITRPYPEP